MEIIADHADKGYPARKLIYKLCGGEEQKTSTGSKVLVDQFFAIKVKQQAYVGRPAIAIYISDYTKKVREKIR